MTDTLTDPTPSSVEDADDLSSFGYSQQLHRSIGSYGSFAAGFSFVSILTTVFQLFFFGFAFGGPSFFFTWPIVFGGQILVALCFAELAARYPLSGCIYQWATRLGGKAWGWTAGWLMLVAQVCTVAAAAIALEVVLPSISTTFQVFDGFGTNAVFLGSILLVITTAINAVGVKVMNIINSVGVTCELVGVVLLCIALFSHAKRGPGVVLQPVPSAPTTSTVVVVGAHLSGLPLNHQLVSRGGTLHRRARTASAYSMLRVRTGVPRPALVPGSSSYDVEVWELPTQGLGELLALVGPPLRLGQVTLSDGTTAVGFLGDPSLLHDAEQLHVRSWRDI